MEKLNYHDEVIPSFKNLVDRVDINLANLNDLPRYKFEQLFEAENDYYKKSTKVFGQAIKYNAKLNEKAKSKDLDEIQGIYIFYENDNAAYVGISRKLIRRLRNHFLGKSHFEASLVYLMARDEYDKTHGLYMKERKDFPFENYRSTMQENMRSNWKISIIPIENHYELYLLEFAIACHLKCKWNAFVTH